MIASFSALGVDTVYCLDSSTQFCRVCLMVQRLHKLSPLWSFMFVRYSGDLIVHLLQGGRGRVSASEVILCLIFSNTSIGTVFGSVSSRGYVA